MYLSMELLQCQILEIHLLPTRVVFYMEPSLELLVMTLYFFFNRCLKITIFLGMLTQLRPDFFEFLLQLQTRLSTVIKSIGKIQHDDWRSFYNERKLEPMEVIKKFMPKT